MEAKRVVFEEGDEEFFIQSIKIVNIKLNDNTKCGASMSDKNIFVSGTHRSIGSFIKLIDNHPNPDPMTKLVYTKHLKALFGKNVFKK